MLLISYYSDVNFAIKSFGHLIDSGFSGQFHFMTWSSLYTFSAHFTTRSIAFFLLLRKSVKLIELCQAELSYVVSSPDLVEMRLPGTIFFIMIFMPTELSFLLVLLRSYLNRD